MEDSIYEIWDKISRGEECGYKQCSYCHGYGSNLKEESDRCTKCNGTGIVKKEDENER